MDTVAAAHITVQQGVTLTILGTLTIQVTITNYGTINSTEGFIEDGAEIDNKTNADGTTGTLNVTG